MKASFYQKFSFWFTPLFLSISVLTYQNCADVSFQNMKQRLQGPGGLACLPTDFNLNMIANNPVNFWIDPVAAGDTYTWAMNGTEIGVGPTMSNQVFSAAGDYTMTVTAANPNCANTRTKTLAFSLPCSMNALTMNGDESGMVGEMLDFIVPHTCSNLTFVWNDGENGPLPPSASNAMSNAWNFPGIYVVSTDVTSTPPTTLQRLSMPVSIQGSCPALNELFVSGPDVAYVNEDVDFSLVVPGCLNIASIHWTFGANSSPSSFSGTNLEATTTYSQVGRKIVNVVVQSDKGESVTLTHEITILNPGNPICDESVLLALEGPTVGTVGQNLRFNVYNARCITPLAYSWNFGDNTAGTPSTTANSRNKIYSSPGVYNVRVAVNTQEYGIVTLHRRVVILPSTSYSWFIGDWGPCNGQCQLQNGGTKTRTIECRNQDGIAVAFTNCPTPIPPSSELCTASGPTCTCPNGQINQGGTCVPIVDGACLSPNPVISSTAALPNPLCAPGSNPSPASFTVPVGGFTPYSCVSTTGGTTAPNCRVTRCAANQSVVGGVCSNNPPTCPSGYHLSAGQCVRWVLGSPGSCSATICGTSGLITTPYVCVNEANQSATCAIPAPASQTQPCTASGPTCTCTPPLVNVGGSCVSAVPGACLDPNPVINSSAALPNPLCANNTTPSPSSFTVPVGGFTTYSCLGVNSPINATNCRVTRCGSNQSVVGGVCTDNPPTCPATYHLNSSNQCVRWELGNPGSCSSNACGVNGTITTPYVCRNTSGQAATCSLAQPPNNSVGCSPNPNTCSCSPPLINNGSGVCILPTTYSWSTGGWGTASGNAEP
jgi:hypothetical protein